MPRGENWSKVKEFIQGVPGSINRKASGRTHRAQGLSEYGSISTVGSTQLEHEQKSNVSTRIPPTRKIPAFSLDESHGDRRSPW